MPRLTKTLLTSAATLACVLTLGCQSQRVENPLIEPDQTVEQTADAQLDFWHELAQRPLVANNDAFHALLLFVDGEDASESYAARVEALKNRDMLPGSFNGEADAAITRGDLAVALVGALDIKGGVMLRITGGTSRRYATRELVYEGIFPESSEHQTFTGTQFIGIIGKAEDYQRGSTQPSNQPAAPEPASETPGESSQTLP